MLGPENYVNKSIISIHRPFIPLHTHPTLHTHLPFTHSSHLHTHLPFTLIHSGINGNSNGGDDYTDGCGDGSDCGTSDGDDVLACVCAKLSPPLPRLLTHSPSLSLTHSLTHSLHPSLDCSHTHLNAIAHAAKVFLLAVSVSTTTN